MNMMAVTKIFGGSLHMDMAPMSLKFYATNLCILGGITSCVEGDVRHGAVVCGLCSVQDARDGFLQMFYDKG
jgi:hypothetical protein